MHREGLFISGSSFMCDIEYSSIDLEHNVCIGSACCNHADYCNAHLKPPCKSRKRPIASANLDHDPRRFGRGEGALF